MPLDQDHYKYRNELLRQYLYLALFVSVPLSPIEYFSGLHELALILLIFAASMVPLLFFSKDSRRYNAISRYFMLSISCLFLAGFIYSSLETDNKYFLLLYPIAAFSIRGVKEGVGWSFVLLISLVFLYLAKPESHAQFSFIYFIVAFFMVGYVVYHYRYYEILNFKHIQQVEQQKDQRIQEQEMQAKVLQELCHTDFLTNLNNRQKLDSVLQAEVSKCGQELYCFSVILMDVDHFKQVNDHYGHQTGDSVLQEIANILLQNTNDTDVVGRWGGEEFIIVACGKNKLYAEQLAEKLRVSIENHLFPEVGHKTASFGISHYQNSESIEMLIERSDKALYKAKEEGRNCVRHLTS